MSIIVNEWYSLLTYYFSYLIRFLVHTFLLLWIHLTRAVFVLPDCSSWWCTIPWVVHHTQFKLITSTTVYIPCRGSLLLNSQLWKTYHRFLEKCTLFCSHLLYDMHFRVVSGRDFRQRETIVCVSGIERNNDLYYLLKNVWDLKTSFHNLEVTLFLFRGYSQHLSSFPYHVGLMYVF